MDYSNDNGQQTDAAHVSSLSSKHSEYQQFTKLVIDHPVLHDARQELIEALRFPGSHRIINLFGPSGTGKTTLSEYMDRHFTKHPEHRLQGGHLRGRGFSLRAEAEERRFGWKDFWRKLLIEGEKAFPDVQLDYRIDGISRDAQGNLIVTQKARASDLRDAATILLREARPFYVMIDEAPHIKKLAKSASEQAIKDQMNIIKDLTDESETVFVLIGTYEMLDIINLNGQQGRRSIDIHIPRYLYATEDEKGQFTEVLDEIQKHIPLPKVPELTQWTEFLYEGSCGCFGVLKPWIDRGIGWAITNNKSTITKAALEQRRAPKGKLLKLATEISTGEQKLRDIDAAYNSDMRTLLGMMTEG
jgi:hypothetical protein